MELNKIRDILINFTQRDWKKEEFENGLHFAQMKYFLIAFNRGDDLYRLKVSKGGTEPPLYVTGGEATIPSDFFKNTDPESSMNVPVGGKKYPVRICNDGLFDYLVNSPVEYPTIEYPICVFRGTKVHFNPTTIQFVNWTYYTSPVAPVFGVDYSRGFTEYVSATSTQLNWNDDDIIFIIQIFLQDLGIIKTPEEIKAKADETK
jgi:hypothetical protein